MGQETQNFRRKNNRMKYALACLTLTVAAAIAAGLLLWGNKSAATAPTTEVAEPFLGSAENVELCGTCTIIPGVDAYKMCHTCYTPIEETTRLACAAEEAVIVTKVKSAEHSLRASDMALIYNECQENRVEDGACEFSLQVLRDPEVDYIEYEPEEAIDETVDPVDEPTLTHSHPGEVKVYYMCVSDDVFAMPYAETEEYPEADTEYALSAVRWNDFEMENFPLLSSALLKCDGSKQITANWDKGKVCVTELDTFTTLQCNSGRSDVRILVAKVKTTSTVELDKKLRKNLAKRTTDLCAGNMSSSSCVIKFSDVFQEGDALPEDGAELQVAFLCSYAAEAIVV